MTDLPKLVRDNIPGIIVATGRRCRSHIASTLEFEQRLKEKMYEETEELYESPSLSEAADVYEVFLATLKQFKLRLSDVIMISEQKSSINGGFHQGVVLDEIIEKNV
jgi:predicted house-cleaning noncanonical NTP pyrophosphatase (MazG superfamily)|tara:strand:+ start:399 stop:719 length:321 start_codon:yes stop_codon:yes gene_type:complete